MQSGTVSQLACMGGAHAGHSSKLSLTGDSLFSLRLICSVHVAVCDSLRSAAKLVIVSSNCPPVRKSEIEYYAMLSKTGVHHYSGSEYQRTAAMCHAQQRRQQNSNTAGVRLAWSQ
jgi:hypothetical protein